MFSGNNDMIMRITDQRNGRKMIIRDLVLSKSADIIERTDLHRCPVCVAQLIGIIISLDISVQIVKKQFQPLTPVQSQDGVSS